jgi:phage terminase large subunit GpA-like protein
MKCPHCEKEFQPKTVHLFRPRRYSWTGDTLCGMKGRRTSRDPSEVSCQICLRRAEKKSDEKENA